MLPGVISVRRLIKLAMSWPIRGVLITGGLSCLVWVRGAYLFGGHIAPILLFIIALPIIGGMLTPEKPGYTVVVFAIGSYLPLNDVPPIPIGLLPFFRTYDVLSSGFYQSAWLVLLLGFPLG